MTSGSVSWMTGPEPSYVNRCFVEVIDWSKRYITIEMLEYMKRMLILLAGISKKELTSISDFAIEYNYSLISDLFIRISV